MFENPKLSPELHSMSEELVRTIPLNQLKVLAEHLMFVCMSIEKQFVPVVLEQQIHVPEFLKSLEDRPPGAIEELEPEEVLLTGVDYDPEYTNPTVRRCLSNPKWVDDAYLTLLDTYDHRLINSKMIANRTDVAKTSTLEIANLSWRTRKDVFSALLNHLTNINRAKKDGHGKFRLISVC